MDNRSHDHLEGLIPFYSWLSPVYLHVTCQIDVERQKNAQYPMPCYTLMDLKLTSTEWNPLFVHKVMELYKYSI